MASRRRKAGASALRRITAAFAFALAAPSGAQSVEHWNADIAEASARFGIPAGWIRRVMSAESDGRTMLDGRPITSRAGAMGLMQLMPRTWRDMRAMLGLGNDPYEPHDNIIAGTAYLRLMYDRFGYPGLFAAYNAGPARYAAFLSGGRALPAETRSYLAALAPITFRKSVQASPSAAGIFALRASPRGDAQAQPPRAPSPGMFVTLGGSPHWPLDGGEAALAGGRQERDHGIGKSRAKHRTGRAAAGRAARRPLGSRRRHVPLSRA